MERPAAAPSPRCEPRATLRPATRPKYDGGGLAAAAAGICLALLTDIASVADCCGGRTRLGREVAITVHVLFSFAGGNGHFQPLVPLAAAAAAAGHSVTVTGRPRMASAVETAGFTFVATGPDRGPPERLRLRELDPEREDRDLREGFGGWLARDRSVGILALCIGSRPDLVVCDETDFGAMIVAERLGIPYATVLVMAAGSFVRPGLVAEPLSRLRAEHRLPPDPALTMPSRYLVLSPFPPSFRDPAFPLPATAHPFRSLGSGAVGDTAPQWPADPSGPPLVYATLGTVFNMESGDLFARMLAGLRALPVTLLVTVGREIDPAEFGPQPTNVHIERYVSQSSVLPHCSLVMSHGGSGSVIGALAHGVPLILAPMGADQPGNVARCEALGVARALDALTATAESIGQAATGMLADPRYRRAAERIRDEYAALPGPAYGVTLLERLAAEGVPILTS